MNQYDYIVVGSGIAGLYTALLARKQGSVLIITAWSFYLPPFRAECSIQSFGSRDKTVLELSSSLDIDFPASIA